MSSIGRTPNYDLPRFLRGSVPQWTGDVGPAFDKIDEVLFAQGGELAGALTAVQQMKLDLQSGLERVAVGEQTANAAKDASDAVTAEVTHVKSDINLLESASEQCKTDIESLLRKDSEIDEKIKELTYVSREEYIRGYSPKQNVAALAEICFTMPLPMRENYRIAAVMGAGFDGNQSVSIAMSGYEIASSKLIVCGRNALNIERRDVGGKWGIIQIPENLPDPYAREVRESMNNGFNRMLAEEYPGVVADDDFHFYHKVGDRWVETTGMAMGDVNNLYGERNEA